MLDKVKMNEHGFYELVNKPTAEQQKEDFEEKYYQECLSGSYEPEYDEDELRFIRGKIEQKEIVWKKLLRGVKTERKQKWQILDIGCGEGFLLKYFWEKGHEVRGIDFSRYGIERNNPELLPYFVQGDCYEKMQVLIANNEKFDIVNMDATLDMVQRPGELLRLVDKVLKKDGILSCKIANNYSRFQLELLKEGVLTREYWLDENGHSWYFNKDGFIKFFDAHGYDCKDLYAEGLIELFLLNELTNYYENPKAGKACYKAKVKTENMMHAISPERTNEIMRQFGQMGLGRELVGVFQLRGEDAIEQ